MKTTLTLLLIFSINNVLASKIFSDDIVISVELRYDIARLQAEKENLRESGLEGSITTQPDNKTYKISILSRGNGSFSCNQPQLKFKFNKKENKKTPFSGIKKVKLFTKGTCLENKSDKEQDKEIIANYLIYKLYEEVTNYSFKTRLLKIKYIDTSKTYATYEQYGFFLEPKKLLEKRLKLTYINIPELLQLADKIPSQTNQELLSTVNGFEFFIANNDYGIPGHFSHIFHDSGYDAINYTEKNSKMFRNKSGEIYPIIYDFDFSRLGYLGPYCIVGYRFFMLDGILNPTCSIEVITSNIKADLKKFKYNKDVHLSSVKILKAFNIWRTKHESLITILGPEYQEGLIKLPIAFKYALNEENK